ncbi:unnamed protein product [Cochlearia groenlandica]
MDCLSYFSNSDPIHLNDCFIPDVDMLIPETDTFFFQTPPQHHDQDHPFHQGEPLSPSLFEFDHFDTLFEPFLSSQEIFLPNPKTEIVLFDESQDLLDSFFPTPKHQKLIDSSSFHYNTQNTLFSNSHHDLLDSYITNNFSEFRVPDLSPAFKIGWSEKESTKKPELSSQSLAARKRRRKITEKTQELRKLVPGSQKHNNAEMFHAAAKYVKFLQAQVEILTLRQAKMKTQEGFDHVDREMQLLLASQGIQEKLSTEEVCVVPREMVKALKSEEIILRNPKISCEINKLLTTYLINN